MFVNNSGHVGLIIFNEGWTVLHQYPTGRFYSVYMHLYQRFRGKLEYPFLNSIDLYGNTYFNSLQVPRLICELQHISKIDGDEGLQVEVDKIVDFLRKARDLDQVWFQGD